MELTARDRKILTDVALHNVMTRDQLIALGYFPCVTRANRRLLTLVRNGFLERVRLNHCLAPQQAVYRASKRAREVLDPRVAAVLCDRTPSAMQFDHAIAVVNARLKLVALGATRWLSEPQCRHRYHVTLGRMSKMAEVRPDGIALFDGKLLFIEVDRGNVAMPRIKAKLLGFALYCRSGVCERTHGAVRPALMIVTTGDLRVRHIKGVVPKDFPMRCFVVTAGTFAESQSLAEVTR